MKKMLMPLLVAAMVISGPVMGNTKSLECKVVSVEGETVVVQCAKGDQLKAREKVTIKTGAKKRAPYGGC